MKNELLAVVKTLDEVFGQGYAMKNPELVGRMLQAEHIAMAASIIYEAITFYEPDEELEPSLM